MGRKKGKRKYTKKEEKLKQERQEVFGTKVLPVIGICFGILLGALIYLKSGILGESLNYILGGLFGIVQYFIPVLIVVYSVKAIIDERRFLASKSLELILLVICLSVLFSIFDIKNGKINTINVQIPDIVKGAFQLGVYGQGGGALGSVLAYMLTTLLGTVGAIVLSFCLTIVLIIFSFGIDINNFIKKYFDSVSEQRNAKRESLKNSLESKRRNLDNGENEEQNPDVEKQIKFNLMDDEEDKDNKKGLLNFGKLKQSKEQKEDKKTFDPDIIENNIFTTQKVEKEEQTKQVLNIGHTMMVEDETYEFPVLSLLAKGEKAKNRLSSKYLNETSQKLQRTLRSFGVSAAVEAVTQGPAITRYELKPAEGVRVSKIANLADDIALNLAAESIRIEAPIPGKQAVGIEIPNKSRETVHLRDVLDSSEFENSKSKTTVALGKGIAGNVELSDISKMPHILIAGSTGSGKSVCINTIITSILYKAKPSEVKFVMVDPKVVELSVYNGIPHLLIPVVTDPKKAAAALAWAVQEMENRYQLFAKVGAREIKGYNEHIEASEENMKLPQIVIIIDELADLMMVAKNEVEDAIVRLAQKARAAGMYLVIATQRPSVDVITGLIKANVPSRIAFAVSSNIDSRTILDCSGAEKLLGKGDMLYSPIGSTKPARIQGAFVTDDEVEKIVGFLKNNGSAQYDEDILESIENANKESAPNVDDDDDQDDALLPEAIKLVIEQQSASTSFIQSRFKVGYARARRIIDQMEARGVISGFNGSKPREVLITPQVWEELNKDPNEDLNEEV